MLWRLLRGISRPPHHGGGRLRLFTRAHGWRRPKPFFGGLPFIIGRTEELLVQALRRRLALHFAAGELLENFSDFQVIRDGEAV